MQPSIIMGISLFAFVMSITPGPNNIMLLASGAQFGYQRTLPHILGIIVGVASLLTAMLLGLDIVFSHYSVLYDGLKVVGSLYLFYLAWKIASASTEPVRGKDKSNSKPFSFLQALLFQYANPKAWAMSIGSVSSFTIAGDAYITSGLWIMLCFAVMGFIAISLWTLLGSNMANYLTTSKRKKYFNYTMGLMTVMTLFFILS